MKTEPLTILLILIATLSFSSVASRVGLSLHPDIDNTSTTSGLQVWFDRPQFLNVDPCAYELDVHAQTSIGLWITSLRWNFGDGSTLNLPFSAQSVVDDIRTHIYSVSGTYAVSVVAFDNAGNTGSAGQTLTNVIPGNCIPAPRNGLPTLSNAQIEQATDLESPAGSQLYLFAFATGGDASSTPFSSGQYVSVTNANGNLVGALGVTPKNLNSFTTQTGHYSIAAASVSGYSSYTETFVSDSSPGSPGVSDHFTVSASGSLVVVLAVGGGEQCINVTGLPGFSVDASNTGYPDQSGAITIGHAYLAANTYVVSEQTQQCATNLDPNNAGNLIGVFIFQPGQNASPSPALRPIGRLPP